MHAHTHVVIDVITYRIENKLKNKPNPRQYNTINIIAERLENIRGDDVPVLNFCHLNAVSEQFSLSFLEALDILED